MPVITAKMDSLIKRSKSDTPVLDYCRYLISENVDPDSELHVYRENDEPDLIVRNIGEGAKLTVSGHLFTNHETKLPKNRRKQPQQPSQQPRTAV